MSRPRPKYGFTLVELLVVIGIIGVLVAILLPALSRARKSAATIKCAASLKQLGNAMLMYTQDNKGYLPAPNITYDYNIGSLVFDYGAGSDTVSAGIVGDNARWFNLIAKYIMKAQAEGAALTGEQLSEQMQRSVIWGCPGFQGFVTASDPNSLKGDTNRNYPPYAMNRWPTFSPSNPDPNGTPHFPTPNGQFVFEGRLPSGPTTSGAWYKLVQYTHPAERALLADSRWLYLEARKPATEDDIPGQPVFQTAYTGSKTPQTTYDFYRHGSYPPVESAGSNGTFSPNGGKVAYNILYADMHVVTANDRPTGYRSIRMRFPK